MASQRPSTMAKVLASACIIEEVLAQQYGPLNNKEKAKTETTSSTNPKLTQNHNQQASKNVTTTKGRGMTMAMVTRIGTTNHFLKTARIDTIKNA